MTPAELPALVLGGTGYVAGELLRLLSVHPHFNVAGVMSESRAGERVTETFPQLQNALGEHRFATRDALRSLLAPGTVALFSAAPHGASAALIAEFVAVARQSDCDLRVVDVSADFRFADSASYETVYGTAHGAPDLLPEFVSAIPEHLPDTEARFIGHPGCFASALLLAAVPLCRMDCTDGVLYATGITGSTGSGRSPSAGTHHPERHSNLYSYKPLSHRHAPEVVGICERLTAVRPQLNFVPHSGPFARGIYLTMQARLTENLSADELRQRFSDQYARDEFIVVRDGLPRLKDIVGSNYAHLGIAVENDTVAVFVAIDNLIKGAAGGAIQWMNRLCGLPDNAGLTAPALGWS